MVSPLWIQIFLDVPSERWDRSVAFWSAATLTTVSESRGEDGQFVTLLPEEGDAWLKIQATPDATARIHLDLDTTDRDAARHQALDLGATDAWTYEDVTVMRSPGGLLFCNTLVAEPERPRMSRQNLDVIADQVCIDIPDRLWHNEIEFWATLVGRDLESGRRPEFAFLGDPDPTGPSRTLLQRLDSDAAHVSAHLDLAVADRASETARHESLGATVAEVFPFWTVMNAPSGHTYCLTDRSPTTGRVAPRPPKPPRTEQIRVDNCHLDVVIDRGDDSPHGEGRSARGELSPRLKIVGATGNRVACTGPQTAVVRTERARQQTGDSPCARDSLPSPSPAPPR